jgi:hypothetical protein
MSIKHNTISHALNNDKMLTEMQINIYHRMSRI